MSLNSPFKNMNLNYWKFSNHFKQCLPKSSTNHRRVIFVLNKEWLRIIQYISNTYLTEIKKYKTNGKFDISILSRVNFFRNEPSFQQKSNGEQNSDKTFELSAAAAVGIADGNKENDKILNVETQIANETKGMDLQYFMDGLKSKIGGKPTDESPADPKKKWMVKKDVISKESINSRTRHVLSSLSSAETVSSRLKRLEDLTSHLIQFPEATNCAIKDGAIHLLLHLRGKMTDPESLAILREGLTILGHVEPYSGKGIKILSIDGGGIRGMIVVEMLKKLEKLTGKRVHEMFDFICGVSTGAILACVIGAQKRSLDEMSEMYKELSTKIFTQNTLVGTSNLVWSHSYYNTEMFEKLLKDYVGENMFIETSRDSEIPKIAAISAIVNQTRVSAFIFRNYALPYRIQSQYSGSFKYKLWEAVRASAAAPSYFEEFRLDEKLHQDGGILVNNPCAIAIHEAKHLWPGSPIQCVVSFGTGRFNPIVKCTEETNTSSLSWKTKFFKILDSATDTEGVHSTLNDLLPRGVYYRFNPYLTEMLTMVEIRPEKLCQLEMDAAIYVRRNENMFKECAQSLLQKKSVVQTCRDWINLRAQLLGVK